MTDIFDGIKRSDRFFDELQKIYTSASQDERVILVERMTEEFTARVNAMRDEVHGIEVGQHYEGLYDITYSAGSFPPRGGPIKG